MTKLFLLILLSFPTCLLAYEKSDHYDGKKFFLPWGDELKSFWEVMKWKMTSKPEKWPKHVPNKNYPMRLLTPTEKVNATFINHATFFLQLPGVNIITDPIYSERTSPVSFAGPKRAREPGMPFDALPPIDVVVISHNHYDHLDLETIKKIDKKFHPLFLVPLGDEKLLNKYGIQNVKAMDWWEEVRIKDVRIIFAPSQHWSARSLWDKNECLWGSFMIDNGQQKIYFAGDTGYGKHFTDIKNRLGAPDLSLLPIGGYGPRWFMKYYHLNPEDAVKAHLDLGSDRSIGMHFGTFQLTDEGIDDPVREFKLVREKYNIPENKFIILDQGQALAY